MYRISKRFTFAASHVLEGLPEGHKCGRLHGHNYEVEVELAGDVLSDEGFVLDYGEMAPFADYLKVNVDHRHLNDVMGWTNPTAEHLARWLHEVARSVLPSDANMVSSVRVYETANTMAEYRP